MTDKPIYMQRDETQRDEVRLSWEAVMQAQAALRDALDAHADALSRRDYIDSATTLLVRCPECSRPLDDDGYCPRSACAFTAQGTP